jgi:hypothetical protein
VKSLVAALAVILLMVAPSAAAYAQEVPTAPELPPAPVLPPGIPTVTPPVDPNAPVDPAVPPPPPAPPIPDPSPQVAVLIAKLHALDVQHALEVSQAALDAATTEEKATQARRDAKQKVRDDAHDQLTNAVTDAYVRNGVDLVDAPVAVGDDFVPSESARLLADHAIDADRSDLELAEADLKVANDALDAAKARTATAQAARDGAQAAVDEAAQAVTDAGKLNDRTDNSPTVMGDPVMTADELVGWYTAQGITGYVGRVDLPTMAGYYIDEGKAEQVRGDVAFAQAMIETGAFTSPLTTHNNFAGIGACDSCPTGWDFPTPEQGVRGQAQLLHAYADKTLRVATLANPAVGANPDHLTVRGCCTTWNKLTGTWATDPNYGPKIMTVYLSMLQYTLDQRIAHPPIPLPAALPGR